MLELDELWSLVFRRKDKRWVWLAQCRRTRQIVAYVIGGRGEDACRLLLHWQTRRVGAYPAGLQGGPALHRLLGGLCQSAAA